MQAGLHAGRDIDRFRIIGKLASGGFATVYLATVAGPSKFNKLVVLKIMDEKLAADRVFVRMFLDEARLAAQLNHPNVVQTYEVLESHGRFVLVMEYLEGFSLKHVRRRAAKRGPFPLSMHLSIISQSLIGLHYAHELTDFHGTHLSLVHRDYKPANLFVTYDGLCKVLDFGIAKTAQSSDLTRGGTIKGTIRHMAPECFRHEPVDRRADIYAVGTVIWEAATGRPIWKGHSDLSVMRALMEGDIPTARSVDPDVPEELDAICRRAMAADRDERYSTAEELRLELESYVKRYGDLSSSSEIGHLMSEWFAEDRSEIKRVTSREIAACEADASLSRPVVTLSRVAVGEDSASSIETLATDGRAGRARRKVRPIVVAALGATVAAAAALAATIGMGRGDLQTHVKVANSEKTWRAGAGALAIGVAQVDPGDQVRLRLRADPPNAILFIDGERVAANPAEVAIARIAQPVRIRAEAPGHRTTETTVIPDRDREVNLTLVRSAMRRHGARRWRNAAIAPAPPGGSPSQTGGTDETIAGPPTTGQGPTPTVSDSLDVDSTNPWGRGKRTGSLIRLDDDDPWGD